MRYLGIAGLTIFAGVWIVWRVQRTPQLTEALGTARLGVATAVVDGRARCGLIEGPRLYNPEGAAYLLVPALRLHISPAWVPIGATVIIPTLAVATVLAQSSVMWWPAVMTTFVALTAQPGIIAWATNYLEAWTFALIVAAFILAVWARHWAWYAVFGLCTGSITYESLYAQVLAVVVVGFAQRRPLALHATQLGAFSVGVLLAVVLHMAQIACFLGAWDVAYAALRDDSAMRLQGGWALRKASLWPLIRDYTTTVLTPRWSHVPALEVAAVVWSVTWLTRWSLRGLIVAVVCVGSVPMWFFLAPAYNLPHLHLFPRLLFGPVILAMWTVPIVR